MALCAADVFRMISNNHHDYLKHNNIKEGTKFFKLVNIENSDICKKETENITRYIDLVYV